ncbi:hypothetical protein CNMCM5623_003945 [Aspergillus felis]|uniref:chitinase n=2 Tax=Aspergillus felis TaxID=1287682 RepID=A0A8H6QDA8_9EURO|nr:hypothetical protein CNMCM5623_003945 [Aspergillus felis]
MASRWYSGRLILILAVLLFSVLPALAQNCSKDNPCATGCCSTSGWCGTSEEHCGAGNCVDTCDYKLECDANNPCKTGCCSKAGFCGLGPDYCGKDACVSGCDAKSECDPGFGAEWAQSSKCPLNVCCSKFGFCGTTSEFCGSKKVKKPSCSLDDSTLDRVVGYYEGWGSRRPCNAFWPERIPSGVYTHINFAFAAINPKTFEVGPAQSDDIDLLQRVTNLKRIDPDLKVMIALGGWTFNDPGATRTIFSDIAGSEDNQRKFFKSLTSFLSTYDLDGVDLDWEYPVADDRGGKKEDFKNFPIFIANLKQALQAAGGRSEVSITLPASYWYLQHFDIVKLQRHVDFFNIMSYDLHGTWDQGNKWTGEYLNAHTNLTEIDRALELLWRNDIDSSKVVMGVAFYSRTYTVVDPGCVTPGCLYASGGKKGDCSGEVGILLNSEIDQIKDKRGLVPVLNKDAAVQLLSWDDQWLSYDDEVTLKMKLDYARKSCLGGVMVWAISHDTADAKYSKLLGKYSYRTLTTKPAIFAVIDTSTETLYETKEESHLQCKWSNCGEFCPSGWKMMIRDDPDRHNDNEIMLDKTTCTKPHGRRFCCPPSEAFPKCGWYGFKGGNCDGTCPSGYREVGSLHDGCHAGLHQAACCTVKDDNGVLLNSMRLYESCDWAAEFPECEQGKCTFAGSPWPTEFVSSSTGSGAVACSWNWKERGDNGGMNGYDPDPQKRKYCCDTSDKLTTWGTCEWRSDIGEYGSSGKRCKSGCKANEIPIALEGWTDCYQDGAQAYCCTGTYRTQTRNLLPELEAEKTTMEAWVKNPTCDNDSGLLRRGQIPLTTVAVSRVGDIFGELLLGEENGNMSMVFQKKESIFNDSITTKWKWLATNYSVPWLTNEETYPVGKLYSPQKLGQIVMCNADAFNEMIGNTGLDLNCTRYEPTADDYVAEEGSDSTAYRRWLEERRVLGRLEKRDKVEQKRFTCIDKNKKKKVILYQRQGYPSVGEWDENAEQVRNAYDLVDWDHCHTPQTQTHNIGNLRGTYATEHPMEVQSLELFFKWAITEGPEECHDIDCDFVANFFNKPVLDKVPELKGLDDQHQQVPMQRFMEQLGSYWNTENFAILQSSINLNKAQLWSFGQPRSDATWALTKEEPTRALEVIRDTIAVFNYLRTDAVWAKFKAINDKIREEMERADQQYKKDKNKDLDLLGCWDAWMEHQLNKFVDGGRDWVKKALKDMEDHWVPSNFDNPQDPFMKQVCDAIQQVLPLLELAAAEAIKRSFFDLGLDGDPMDTSA